MPLRIGDTFAGYRILRLLGSGGMGEVYVVQHPRLPRQDALKVLRSDVSGDTSFRERFIREADLVAGLRHPHIVGIHDRGEHNGQLWIAMDYIDGTDAAHLMQQRYPAGMPAELAIPIITAVASTLDYAHKKGLLHRDVKPANIIVADLDSDERRVFLADFGIARPLDDTSSITTTNMTVGTVAYAAPEQLMGEQMDGRADQYALAATTYQLLTGLQLFTHSNPAVVISRHLNTMPPALGDHRPDLAGLDDALRVALAKDPDNRYSSCTAFAHALMNASVPATSHRTTASAPVVGDRAAPGATAKRYEPSATKEFATRRPPQPIQVHEPKPQWPVIVSTIVIIALLAGVGVAFVVRPWEHNGASNGTTGAPTNPTPPSITFESMRDFVTGYYRDLPTHPMDAWSKLDKYCQQQTGLDAFVGFWATVRSVELVSVSPRDASSVVARLRYMRQDGQTDTEDRWLSMDLVNDTMLLHESGRIGQVSDAPSPSQQPLPPPSSTVALPDIRTALPACYGSRPIEEQPTSSSIACRHHWYENLSWSTWGPDAADGKGIEVFQNCIPYCYNGQMFRNPVEVHFSGPAPPPPGSQCLSDLSYYTQLIVAYPRSSPPPEEVLNWGGVVSTTYNGMTAYRWNGLTPDCDPSR